MKIKLTAKRVFKNNPDFIVYDIKGFKTPVRIKIKKSDYVDIAIDSNQGWIENYIKTKIYEQIQVEVE